jgi:hypothetical protein
MEEEHHALNKRGFQNVAHFSLSILSAEFDQ